MADPETIRSVAELRLPRANYWIYPEGGYDHDANVERYLASEDAPLPVAAQSLPDTSTWRSYRADDYDLAVKVPSDWHLDEASMKRGDVLTLLVWDTAAITGDQVGRTRVVNIPIQ